MEKNGDKRLEKRLKKVVELALLEDGAEHTVRTLRRHAEKELKLEERFFETEAWKLRSKDIIKAAVNGYEPDEDSPQSTSSRPVLPSETPEPKSNGKTGEESSDDSDEGESSEEDGSSANQTTTEQNVGKTSKTSTAVNGVKRKSGETSSEGDSSDDSSESESESEPQEPAQKKAKVTPPAELSGDLHSSQGENQVNTHYLGPIPAKPFQPPAGYSQLDSEQLSVDPDFSQTKLQGKQIWYLSAPSGLPLDSLAQISQAALKARAPILNQNGNDFILGEATEHTDDSNSCVFIPKSEGYERTSHKVHRTLRIQQKIALPDLNSRQANQLTGSDAAANVGRAAIKSVRPQPKGLRMRYRPPGFGTGPLGNIGSESTDSGDEEDLDRRAAPRTFQFPRTLGAYGTEARQDGDVDVEMADATAEASQASVRDEAKKSKKEKKKRDKRARETNASAASIGVNGTKRAEEEPRAVSAESQDVDREESPDNAGGADMPNGVAKDVESKEERARRKEERRARKAAKKERKLQASQAQ